MTFQSDLVKIHTKNRSTTIGVNMTDDPRHIHIISFKLQIEQKFALLFKLKCCPNRNIVRCAVILQSYSSKHAKNKNRIIIIDIY